MLNVFSSIFVADTKIIIQNDFVAPLAKDGKNHLNFKGNFYFLSLLKIFISTRLTLISSWIGSSCLTESYTDEDFWKDIQFFNYKLLKSLQ